MTRFNFEILKDVNTEEWNKNLKKCNYSNFFQTAEYLYSQKDENKKFPVFIYVYDELGGVKGQLGIVIQKSQFIYSTKFLKPFAKIITIFGSRGSWVGGPIIHSDDDKRRKEVLNEIINAIEKIANINNLIIIDGYTPPQDTKINEEYKLQFKNKKYSIRNFITYVTDLLKSEEFIWNQMHKSAKRDVTKAQKNEIIVKELDKEQLDDFFNLSKIWAKTKGIEKSSNFSMKEKYWNYYKKGIEKIFLAYENNVLVSSHRIGCFNKIVYSHSLVNSYSKAGTVSGSYLTWYALQWAKKNGMIIYDYSGGIVSENTSKNNKNIKQLNNLMIYKKKWGGQKFPYYHFTLIRKKNSYKIMRSLLKLDWILRERKRVNKK